MSNLVTRRTKPDAVKAVTYQRPVEASLHVMFADGTHEPATPADLERFGYYPSFGPNIPWLSVTIETAAGASINQVARDAVTLAKIVQEAVKFDFNGVEVTVEPGDRVDQVLDQYDGLLRNAREVKS